MILSLFTIVNGQKLKTFSDNFESYTTNAWLAQNSSVWNTWSGTPSSSGDDVRVTNSDSYSGSKSIYFSSGPGPEDVILPFGGLHQRGQFVYTSMMKIPSGKTAYFNFQGAASVGSVWAAEVSFNKDSTIVFSNNTSGTMFQSTYPQGKWFEMKIYANLTKNEWHVYIDNEYRGYFSNSINKVSFVDIYPANKDASFWVDDVSFIYASAVPNNAGIEVLTSPSNAICGKNDLKVKVVNNGTKAMDSVRVNWMVDGVAQSPVLVKSTIDTIKSSAGNTLEVTLDSVFNLKKGLHSIVAWTSFPNGIADTLNFDDTLKTTLKAEIRGGSIDYSTPFQGKKGKGTLAWPDTVCAKDTINYAVSAPSGYTNAEFGTGWKINSVNIKSNGVAPKDTLTIKPSGKTNFRLRYMSDSSESNSIFKIEISMSVGSGCDTVLTHYFFVAPLPHTSFTTNDACLGKLTRFVNTSKGGGKNDYLWNFGDNTTSRFIGTSKRYTSTGTYNVTLRATAPSGCRTTVGQTISVFDIPEPKFSVLDACDSSSVVFKDTSVIANGSITGYRWEFGDGDTSNIKNATHTYKKVGTYSVRLTVTSDQGCTEKVDGQATVFHMPYAAFSANNSCQPVAVNFSNGTKYDGTAQLTYDWDFGDGNNSTLKEPEYKYGSAGNYSVKLKAITDEGCVDSVVAPLEVYAVPVADFNATNACLGEATLYTNTSSVSSGSITSYNWSLREGNKSTLKDPVVKYENAGINSIQLIVTGTGGCIDTVIKDVEVYPTPSAVFASNNACLNSEVVFDNQSTTTSDTIEYQWNFGDGNTSIDQTPKNTYTKDGTYNVLLVVNSENGCKDSVEKSIEIYPLPEAGFTFKHKGFGQYDFTPDNESLATYNWDFGDGKTSADVTPYHEYAAEGDYNVTLKTSDDNSCSSELTNSVSVSTSIAEKHSLSPITVFPNPFKDEVNIVYELQNASNVSIEVYSLNGKLMASLVNQKQTNGKYQYKFDTPEASGIYLVKMVINGNVYHEQIIKAQ